MTTLTAPPLADGHVAARTKNDDGPARAGYAVETMRGKIAQRAVQNGLVTLGDLHVPEGDR